MLGTRAALGAAATGGAAAVAGGCAGAVCAATDRPARQAGRAAARARSAAPAGRAAAMKRFLIERGAPARCVAAESRLFIRAISSKAKLSGVLQVSGQCRVR